MNRTTRRERVEQAINRVVADMRAYLDHTYEVSPQIFGYRLDKNTILFADATLDVNRLMLVEAVMDALDDPPKPDAPRTDLPDISTPAARAAFQEANRQVPAIAKKRRPKR